MKELLWLSEPGCTEVERVGGKAANLSRLLAHHPIPPGFCLTAAAHARWGGKAHEPFPDALTRLVEDAYTALGERCGMAAPVVAVRSSAVDEDGANASFAGIYVTFLNVRGAQAVQRAIARCWAAAADPRVKAYRESRGLGDAGLGVLVQQLVVADASAVVFSANPVTGARDEVVINANWGLGESIVSGVATPDTWILGKPDLTTRQFHLGKKEQMTILSEEGTKEVAVLRTLRGRPALDDARVRRLGQLALGLEDAMGWPVDIECAYAAEKLYLLQCRPITTHRADRSS
jgi:pyruvate,water dikinase